MNALLSSQNKRHRFPHTTSRSAASVDGLCFLAFLALLPVMGFAAAATPKTASAWPQDYTVQRNDAAGLLTFRTPYYVIEHDLKQGGAISRIALTHGKAANLLVRPVETRIRDAAGSVLTDLKDAAPKIEHRRDGQRELLVIESHLTDPQGRASGVRLRTTCRYGWGYVKIRKEFLVPADGIRVLEVCPLATVIVPTLTDYGYREGLTEEDGAPPFSFGSNRWGKLRPGQSADRPLQVRHVPRSMLFADPGVEGLEWFVGSDLWQWDLQLAGRRGQGSCVLQLNGEPAGLALSVSPLSVTNTAVALTNSCVFDYYLAVPLLEGRALKPWVHTSFNRNRGNWVATEEIRGWAEKGYQTVHCHNDGDYYDDGLFWRDGAYPPYPDMERYDKVLQDCRRFGIRTATYFSNKELHPSTKEFQEQGSAWGRKNRKGDLQHNYFRGKSEFGVQMCLRSGWLEFLKTSIDRVLKNHPLDGVYYDWNVALFCCNPLHEGKKVGGSAIASGHWDVDELIDLMEWTRNRVGPAGLVIVHNTTTPMYAAENFADHVVATEWGYQKWTDRAPELSSLPLEWSLAGARSRGVISYGTIDSKAPRRLHRLFALQALLGGVTPWPASPETFELLPLLKLLGDIQSYRFADWRNQAVTLSDSWCASAIYSQPGVSYLLLANLGQGPREVNCVLHPERLPHPLARPAVATKLARGTSSPNGPDNQTDSTLDVRQLIGAGVKLVVPGDDAILIRVR